MTTTTTNKFKLGDLLCHRSELERFKLEASLNDHAAFTTWSGPQCLIVVSINTREMTSGVFVSYECASEEVGNYFYCEDEVLPYGEAAEELAELHKKLRASR